MQPGVACIAFRLLARFSSGRRGSLSYLEEQRIGAFSIFDPSTSVLEFSKFLHLSEILSLPLVILEEYLLFLERTRPRVRSKKRNKKEKRFAGIRPRNSFCLPSRQTRNLAGSGSAREV